MHGCAYVVICARLQPDPAAKYGAPRTQRGHELDQQDRDKDDCRPDIAEGRQALAEEDGAAERGEQALGRRG